MSNLSIKTLLQKFRLSDDIDDWAYAGMKDAVEAIAACNHITHRFFYIIDFHRLNFLHVFGHKLYPWEYAPEEIKEMGFDFYARCVPQEELGMLSEIVHAGFRSFAGMSGEEKMNISFYYNFKMRLKGLTVLACHQFTPLKLHNGKLWLALCSITPASHPAPGRVFLRNSRHPATSQYYSFKEKAWSDFAPFHISPTEMLVILCHLKGMNIGDTAREISRTTYAVKKIRKALLNKSGVDNFTSFCQLALLHQQI